MTFPMYANHESCLFFSLGNLPKQEGFSTNKHEIKSINKVTLFGLLTHFKGTMHLEGKCNAFVIEFKPNGFNRLFGIAADEICNNNFPAYDVLGSSVEDLYEQLLTTVNVKEMALLADKYLIDFLNRKKRVYIHEGITKITGLLLTNINTINIKNYALLANMSLRNFERRFTEQVGTSPKLFCRLLRFNKSLQLKIAHPEKSWTEIAYECGYFDSMHLIKDFKQFTNESPFTFLNEHPDLTRESFVTIQHTAV